MKKFLFLFLISISLASKSQTFTISYTTFEVGDSLVLDIIFHFNHSRIIDEEIHLGVTEEERESLHAINRRTAFKIIALC